MRRAVIASGDGVSYVAGSQLAPGATVAGYRIEALIGRGGMGAVYRAADERPYRYRRAHARRLLEQARCRRGTDGIYVCAEERLSLRLVTTAGLPTRTRTVSIIQEQLRRVGVEVLPQFGTPPVVFGQIIPRGNFDVALFTFGRSPDPVGMVAVYGCGGEANFTGHCQRLLTADLDQADRILDERHQARVLNRADRRLARDVPVIPLFQFVRTAAYLERVRNYVMPPFNAFWNAENWWLER